jgi:hypothetical protein
MLSMLNLARVAKIVALLLFVLPWVTVSCAEQTLISMTGVDLATGKITMTNPMTGASESPPGSGGGDMLVVVGAILILLALAATFVLKRRTGALAAMAGSAGAAAALAYTVLVRVPESARANALSSGNAGTQGMSDAQIAEMIRVNIEIGFWLVLAALAAAIVLDLLAMRGADAAAAPAAAPAATDPPPEPPA